MKNKKANWVNADIQRKSARINQFTSRTFAQQIEQACITLLEAFSTAEKYQEKRSSVQGSPCMWYPYPSQKPARSVDMNSMPRSHFALFQK